MNASLKVALMTHRGAVRRENQDAVFASGVIRTGDMAAPEFFDVAWEGQPVLFAVIDGMGGYQGGALAARLTAEALAGAAEKKNTFGDRLDVAADGLVLRRILEDAGARMRDAAGRAPELAEMGAAVSGLLLRGKGALAFNCGDCRTYRLSAGYLEKVTRDHSIVQALFEEEKISEDDMRTHPNKNIVTSAVSADPELDFQVYVKGLSLCGGDSFFLCSDGVWEALPSQDITRHLSGTRPCAELFGDLMAAGCRDNVSFISVTPECGEHGE
jgi:protein phosphatase